jgi:hypothetical protein
MPKSSILQVIQIPSKTLKTNMYGIQIKIVPHKQYTNVFRDFQIFQHVHSHNQRWVNKLRTSNCVIMCSSLNLSIHNYKSTIFEGVT